MYILVTSKRLRSPKSNMKKSSVKISKTLPASKDSQNLFSILSNENNGHSAENEDNEHSTENIKLPKPPPIYIRERESSTLVNSLLRRLDTATSMLFQ